jgi:hypothetical protein
MPKCMFKLKKYNLLKQNTATSCIDAYIEIYIFNHFKKIRSSYLEVSIVNPGYVYFV